MMSLLMKQDFSSLFLIKDCFLVWICSSRMVMSIEMGVWLEKSLQSGWMQWLLSSGKLGCRKTRLMTEFDS